MNNEVFVRTEHLDDCSCPDHPGKTRIPAEVFDLPNLKAMGIYSYLLTFPKSELFTPGKIAEASKDGVDSVKSGITTLLDVGWIDRADVPETFGWVYLIQALETLKTVYKIGKAEDPWQRYIELQLICPVPIEPIRFITAVDMGHLERSLHKKYDAKRMRFNGKRGEWFALSEQEVDEIKQMEMEM